MSDLVERVARIIDPAQWRMIDDYLGRPEGSALHTAGVNYRDMALTKARAAIKAVAEWIEATGYAESEYWADVLKERAANEQ